MSDRAREPSSYRNSASIVRKVLIIDDDLDCAESLRDLLELDGFQVHVTLNGNAGITAALQRAADVVLCDIGLPDMTGFEVARALKASAEFNGKLVALTGYAGSKDERLAAEAGFDHLLPKPADMDKLAAILGNR